MSREDACAALKSIADSHDAAFDLTAFSIACSLHDDPDQSITQAHEVFLEISEAAPLFRGDPENAISSFLHGRLGFRGDTTTYDDLKNADILSVVVRRLGLPVTLGIVYRHAARVAKVPMAGVDLPGHFLLRLETTAEPAFIDAFSGGKKLSAIDVGRLVGADVSSTAFAEMIAPMSDRRIALRLQNNIWTRVCQARKWDAAERVAARRCILFPAAPLKFDHAWALAQTGAIKGALATLDEVRALRPEGGLAENVNILAERLRAQLH
jgi:regulator of sirC expression with transglutaminase-like and TPR domain